MCLGDSGQDSKPSTETEWGQGGTEGALREKSPRHRGRAGKMNLFCRDG